MNYVMTFSCASEFVNNYITFILRIHLLLRIACAHETVVAYLIDGPAVGWLWVRGWVGKWVGEWVTGWFKRNVTY